MDESCKKKDLSPHCDIYPKVEEITIIGVIKDNYSVVCNDERVVHSLITVNNSRRASNRQTLNKKERDRNSFINIDSESKQST